MERAVRRRIRKHTDGSFEDMEDLVALEKKVRISVNGKEIIALYCTPHMVKELVVGLLMTEGIIRGNWCADRMSILFSDDILVDVPAEGEVVTEGKTITSGCVGGVTFEKKIDA
ncbi:MAG: formate dehydrogenase accessory sulfurtransferase FdhD [Nitrospirae bacterium]|nr:formate dehydrogenase accessory sulfurtransferase FdhD [Nitrospirota bacterium]